MDNGTQTGSGTVDTAPLQQSGPSIASVPPTAGAAMPQAATAAGSAQQPPQTTSPDAGGTIPQQPTQNAPTPDKPVPAVNPSTPHAGLLQMIQGLSLGMDAFGKAIATHGREGGVEEVQQVHAQQQQQAIEKQQAAQEQEERSLRMKVMNANLNMSQAQFEHSQRLWPLEEKNMMLGYRDELAKAMQDAPQWVGSSTEEMEGFLGAGTTPNPGAGTMSQQPGVITVPFTSGQDQAAVLKSVQAAVPAGKTLSGDYVTVVNGGHGNDGNITLIPSDNPILDRPAPPPLVRTFRNSVDLAEKQADVAGVSDDPRFKAAQAQADNIVSVIDGGGTPSYRQMQQLYFSVIPQMTSIIGNKLQTDKTAQQVAEANTAVQTSDVVDQLSKPGELGKPDSVQTIQAKLQDPKTAPTDVPRLRALLALAPAAQQAVVAEKQKELEAQQLVTQGDPTAAGELLADGSVTLPDLKTRGATPQWITRAIQSADSIVKQRGYFINPGDGITSFNAPQMDGFAKVANSEANAQFFGNTNSLLTKGGTLDQLSYTGKTLPKGMAWPVFNNIGNWVTAATGGGPTAAYAANALSVADDYAKVMGGGTGTDAGRMQVLQLFNAAHSPTQLDAALQQVREGVRSQREGRIGSNPYLKNMYPDPGGVTPSTYGAGNAAANQNVPGGITVTAPDGSVHSFPNQQAADQFKQAAGIR